MKKACEKNFAKRALISYFFVILLLFTCMLRLAAIASGNYALAQSNQSLYKINIAKLRGTIYDCNMLPLTNVRPQTVAAVMPTPEGITSISRILKGEPLNDALYLLNENKPAICYLDKDVNARGIKTSTVYKRYDDKLLACHLIGYTDDRGHGVSGLEKAYDELLYSTEYLSAIFEKDGKGRILKGVSPRFENDLSIIKNGVVTTLDTNIQAITENALSRLNSGCAIVCEAKSAKIRAVASMPAYDINNIAAALNQSNSPMLNRAMLCYNIGSVFKPCVAAAAIENGFSKHVFNCAGQLKIDDRNFKCHNILGHGVINLSDSLAQSCNCFFYNLAINLQAEALYKKAAALSINSPIKLAHNFFTARGNLPKINTLTTDSALANFAIGQGNLLASPISMLNLYNAIATDGSYILPSVVEYTLKDGVKNIYDSGSATTVMNAKTAKLLREYLKKVITDGTGVEAAPTRCVAAGKTATAQTGRYYENGAEITNSWFCGFFPADNPEYVVVVMSDSASNVSTSSIFAQITDEVCELKGINVENYN